MLTTRQRFALHATQASCAGCHQLMDPIGLGFENYDGVGQFRDRRKRSSPSMRRVSRLRTDVDGPFDGVPALLDKPQREPRGSRLRGHPVVPLRLWQDGNRTRTIAAFAACKTSSTRRGQHPRALLALSQTDAFLYRPVVVPPTGAMP